MATRKVNWTEAVAEIHEMPSGYSPTLEEGIQFFSEDSIAELRRLLRNCESGEIFDGDFSIRTGKGNLKWVRVIGQPEIEDGRCVRLWGSVQDITAQKQMALQLQRRERLLGGIAAVALQLMAKLPDECERIQSALRVLGEMVEADRVYLFTLDKGGEGVSQAFEWCAEGILPQIDNRELQGLPWKMGIERWKEVLYSGGCIEGHVRHFPEPERSLLNPQDVRSILVSPINIEGAFYGFLGFDMCRCERDWSPDERAILGVAASLVGLAHLQERIRIDLLLAKERAGQLAQRAEDANQAKSRFLANITHEIRTPLNGLLGYTQLLLQAGKFTAENSEKRYLDSIQRSGDHLLNLINDLLDLSKIEAGKMGISARPFGLVEVVGEVMDILRPNADMKQLDYSLIHFDFVQQEELVGPLPSRMVGDVRAVRQVLMNLVSNAIKFTRTGYVRLKVGKVRECNGKDRMRFSVEDSGVGLENHELQRVFEEFFQGGHLAEPLEGTGLGLSISSRLVQMMGGVLRVCSDPGKGSVFWFDLPVEGKEEKVGCLESNPGEFWKQEFGLEAASGITAIDASWPNEWPVAVRRELISAVEMGDFGRAKALLKKLRSLDEEGDSWSRWYAMAEAYDAASILTLLRNSEDLSASDKNATAQKSLATINGADLSRG